MNPEKEKQENISFLINSLYKELKKSGIESEITVGDKHYKSLKFKVKPEDRGFVFNSITMPEFIEFMKEIGCEVLELDNGEGIDRIVVQLREGPILDRINYANELQELANSHEIQLSIFCEEPEFNRLRILCNTPDQVDPLFEIVNVKKLRERLSDLDFVACKIQDGNDITQLAIMGKPLINF